MAQKITTIDFIIILLQHMDIGSEITQKTDSSPDISISPAHIVFICSNSNNEILKHMENTEAGLDINMDLEVKAAFYVCMSCLNPNTAIFQIKRSTRGLVKFYWQT